MSPANLRTPANIANALTWAQSRYFKVDVSKLAMLAPPWSPSSLAVLDVWSRALMGHPFVRIEGCAMGQVLHGSASHFRSDCIIAAGEWRIDADRPVRSLERARHPDAAGQAVAPHDGEARGRGEILLRAAVSRLVTVRTDRVAVPRRCTIQRLSWLRFASINESLTDCRSLLCLSCGTLAGTLRSYSVFLTFILNQCGPTLAIFRCSALGMPIVDAFLIVTNVASTQAGSTRFNLAFRNQKIVTADHAGGVYSARSCTSRFVRLELHSERRVGLS